MGAQKLFAQGSLVDFATTAWVKNPDQESQSKVKKPLYAYVPTVYVLS